MWTPSGGTVPIAPAFSQAWGVSRDGQQIAGSAGSVPFLYTVGSGLATYSAFNGNEVTEFRAFSGDGNTVIGDAFTGGSGGQTGQAFRWTPAGGYVSLGSIGPVGGLVQSYYAHAVNYDATLIGGTQGDQRAWIWDPAHGMRDLRSVLVNDFHYNLAGWAPIDVTAISGDGRYIVGDASFNGGTAAAFIAVIPCPECLWVIAALPLAIRRRSAPVPGSASGAVLARARQ
jgi:hypothetical protein